MPQSPALLGQGVVFTLEAEVAIRAIDYVDGDGGYLMTNLIAGFQDFVDSLGVPSLNILTDGRDTLVAFRELYHDAVELNHVYRHVERRSPRSLGVEALREARGNIATAEVIHICCNGTVDFYQKRVLVEIILDRGHSLTSNGEAMIRKGLSVPLDNAPQSYHEAKAAAEHQSLGIYDVFPAEVANLPSMRPDALRRQLPGTVTSNGQHYTVVLNAEFRNESHMRVNTSQIPSAGNGMFTRANPSGSRDEGGRTIYIKANTPLCVYSSETITQQEWAALENTDYVMQTSYPSPTIFNAPTYNGTNIGRYVNQGGLPEAIRKMVEVSSRIFPAPDWKAVEETAEAHCNVVYKRRRGIGLVIELKQDMVLTGQSQELYANYSIEGYWVPYFADKVAEFGTGNECVHAVLWCACSCDSNWSQRDREAVHCNLRRHGRQPDEFANLSCPWPISSSRQTLSGPPH